MFDNLPEPTHPEPGARTPSPPPSIRTIDSLQSFPTSASDGSYSPPPLSAAPHPVQLWAAINTRVTREAVAQLPVEHIDERDVDDWTHTTPYDAYPYRRNTTPASAHDNRVASPPAYGAFTRAGRRISRSPARVPHHRPIRLPSEVDGLPPRRDPSTPSGSFAGEANLPDDPSQAGEEYRFGDIRHPLLSEPFFLEDGRSSEEDALHHPMRVGDVVGALAARDARVLRLLEANEELRLEQARLSSTIIRLRQETEALRAAAAMPPLAALSPGPSSPSAITAVLQAENARLKLALEDAVAQTEAAGLHGQAAELMAERELLMEELALARSATQAAERRAGRVRSTSASASRAASSRAASPASRSGSGGVRMGQPRLSGRSPSSPLASPPAEQAVRDAAVRKRPVPRVRGLPPTRRQPARRCKK